MSEPAVSPVGASATSDVLTDDEARQRAYRADLGLVGVTLVWGSTFVVVKGALGNVGPFEFVAMRFGIACLALLLVGHRRGDRVV